MAKLIRHPWLLAFVLGINMVGLVYQSVTIHARGTTRGASTAKITETTIEPPAATVIFDSPINAAGSANIPIITYHKTPADFESQLMWLRDRGYTTITMDQAAQAIGWGGQLPAKPVVLTFDDGFADQMRAFELLQKYQMKATFYLITGGEASRWCIGIERRFDQGYGCGDAYLSWDQVVQLDRSGLIEIAAHTVNHPEMDKRSFETQLAEFKDSKAAIESHIGKAVRHTAYPYGRYSQATIQAARQAGFVTAVTTKPGTAQTAAGLLSLYRTTSVKSLP